MVAGDAVFPAAATKTPKSMNQYFFAKVSFLRQQNDGTIKKESEQYLVDAMSFTETEARVIKEVGESVRELYIDSVARSPITEVVTYGDTDLWFKCKVVYKDVDPDSGKEKKTTLYILVNANDAHEAYERCKDHLKEMLVPFEIPKVEETSICEIYQYEKPVPKGMVKIETFPKEIMHLTVDMLQRREDVKRLFGEKYEAKVSASIPIIETAMRHYDTDNPFKAVWEMSKEDNSDEILGSLMIASAVEMVILGENEDGQP